MSSPPPSTLSSRGRENALIEDYGILTDDYDAATNPTGVISLGIAENAPIDPRSCSYGDSTIGSHALRAAFASHVNRHFAPRDVVTSAQVLVQAGVTAVNEVVAWSLTDPDTEGIMLGMPCYGAFEPDFMLKARTRSVYASVKGVDPFSDEVVSRYEKTLLAAREEGTTVKALVITNPDNPLGQCYPPSTLIAIMSFCDKYKIHLISDEIYALSVFDSGNPAALPFTSVLSFDTAGLIDPNYVHVMYGMSKDFGCGGLRIGCLITRNTELQRAITAISRFSWPSGPSCVAATAMLSNTEWADSYAALARRRLGENYRFATSVLEEAGIPYHKGGNAGFFLWLDLSAYLPKGVEERLGEKQLAKRMLDKGVWVASGEAFHAEQPGCFRLVFTHSQPKLKEGIRRLLEALKAAD